MAGVYQRNVVPFVSGSHGFSVGPCPITSKICKTNKETPKILPTMKVLVGTLQNLSIGIHLV